MRVALFVTCLVDLMRPRIGFSAIDLLEAAGCEVVVPAAQTCCGQPAWNSGDRRDTQRIPSDGNPGFAHLTLRGGWRVTQQLELTAALENLLDQEYRYTGSGSNEPGFGAVLGATLRF